jgi:hypothetical protein
MPRCRSATHSLSVKEDIPSLGLPTASDRHWGGRCIPVMDEVKAEATPREAALVTLPTREAIRALQPERQDTNAILHLTC